MAEKGKKNLVIVESPTKARTIAGFLGRAFRVISSYGHIRDLPKSKFGIEIKEEGECVNFVPQYIIPTKARKNVSFLKKEAARAKKIILATDEDREGEAISWHLNYILTSGDSKLKLVESKPVERIVFHEITKKAIEEALEKPRTIDEHLVNSQQARRLLDRIVGYKLSPFLWRKVARGLSAGRVQSVALRLACERESQIKNFKSETYYTIQAVFKTDRGDEFPAEFYKINDKVLTALAFKNKEVADKLLHEIQKSTFVVSSVQKREIVRHALPPFTTSTLAQEAFKRLRFPARTTMAIAQHLYEGVNLGEERVGLITYMRTDSTNLNIGFVFSARDYIKEKFGNEFAPEKPNFYKTKSKLAQEAHEAIRPTNSHCAPHSIKQYLTPQEFKLYDLIFRRFTACQMANAIFDEVIITVAGADKTGGKGAFYFKSRGITTKFPGYQKMWQTKIVEIELPDVKEREGVHLLKIQLEEHQTQPPSRYSDASLIKILEDYGIGRPSTYAPIISTLISRGYIARNKNKVFEATELGELVNNLLVTHFPEIVDYKFTCQMEGELDEVAENKRDWQAVLTTFYRPFIELVEQKEQEIQKSDINHQETNETCEKCGKKMVSKIGRFGRYLACSGFPECRNTKSLREPPKKTGVACPKCKNGELVERTNRRGQKFFGCSTYPECNFTVSTLEKVSADLLSGQRLKRQGD